MRTTIAASGVEEQLSGFTRSSSRLLPNSFASAARSSASCCRQPRTWFTITTTSSSSVIAAPPRASCIVSLAAAANGDGLSFYSGTSLKDPEGLLQGAGKQNRFIRSPSVESLALSAVIALTGQAVEQAKVPLPPAGIGPTVIQSVSTKQRLRRIKTSGI
jgi:hypothetical protein